MNTMEIRKMVWKNDLILGDLTIDVTKDSTTSFKNVVLVGDNGCGKTTILKKIATFLNFGHLDFETIEYKADSNEILTVSKFRRPDNVEDQSFHYLTDSKGQKTKRVSLQGTQASEIIDMRRNGFVFSRPRSDFKTTVINSVTSQSLDNQKQSMDNQEDFTSLKQLLIDIESQDNEEYRRINKATNPPIFERDFSLNNSKIFRFKNAINNFFDTIKFDSIKTTNNAKEVIFLKNNQEIKIDDLSTGEKQIVFRGIYLLKNLQALKGGIVLIDEPELSMHPLWQEKVFKYYRDIFMVNGSQIVQIFFATHSEHVLETALNDSDTIVIILKQELDKIVSKKIVAPFILPQVTASEINFFAFNIYSADYHTQLFNFLPDKLGLDDNHVSTIDDAIKCSVHYNVGIHQLPSSFVDKKGHVHNYTTISSYIRNEIHHKPNRTFTQEQLRVSIDLLTKICR